MGGFTGEHCKAQFDAFATNGASTDPDWFQGSRRAAIDKFGAMEFPSTRQEEWRFTNVKDVVSHAFELAGPSEDVEIEALRPYRYADDAIRLTLVNGRLDLPLSGLNDLPDGVVAVDLHTAVREYASLVRPHLANEPEDRFAALNQAFARDGIFIHVSKGVQLARQIEVLYVTVGGANPIMTHPRTVVLIDDEAQATVVETYAGLDDGLYLTNAATVTQVGNGASLDWYRVQRESPTAYHFASTRSVLGRDSHYAFVTAPFGAALSRHDVRMVMDGEGGEGTLNGLYVANGTQHVDHQTVIEHAKPHCQSFEYFNGILDDKARAVFNGRIIVHPGAQKTDSKQTNNNLLLSDTARADSQPQLEIYADDVRCTHGATLGPLDDNSLFYLQSRGLNADVARRMMTYGFAREILDRIKSDTVRESMESLVLGRLREPKA